MTKINWTALEGRFFDTGLDRGVLYPKTPLPPKVEASRNLFTNPSFEAAGVGAAAEWLNLEVNLIPNPSMQTNLTGWSGYAGDTAVGPQTRPTDGGYSGNAYLRTTITTAGTTPTAVYYTEIPVTAGTTYTFSAAVRTSTSQQCRATLEYRAVSGGAVTGSFNGSATNTTATWGTRVNVTGAAPAGALFARLIVWTQAVLPLNATMDVDAAMLTATSTAVAYYDGDTTANTYNYSWSGTAHASTSIKRNTGIATNNAVYPTEKGATTSGPAAAFGPRWGATGTTATITGVTGLESMGITTAARRTTTVIEPCTQAGWDLTGNYQSPTTQGFPVDVGKTYTISFYARSNAPLTNDSYYMSYQFNEGNGSGTPIVGTLYSTSVARTAVDTWQRVSATFTAPVNAGCIKSFVNLTGTGNIAVGTTIDVTGLMVHEGPIMDYFDGVTKGGVWNSTDFTVGWAGVAKASVSRVRPTLVVTGPNYTNIIPVQSTAWAKSGTKSLRLIPTYTGPHPNYKDNYVSYNLLSLGVQEGRTYTVRAVARQASTLVGAAGTPNQARNIFLDITGGGGGTRGFVNTTSHTNAPGEYVHQLTFTVPKVTGSPVTGLNFRLYHGHEPGGQGTNDLWWDNLMLIDGTEKDIPAYFDGSSTNTTKYTYSWAGTANASASIKMEQKPTAVAWMGLQSVDEEGGDSAAAYYIDGRPFLFLPRPKEYKATLKAVTYPDEFSEIMGVHEVADGMYLDSQPGDSFDLAYRTLVGGAIKGVDQGYKIHLVYNCTVAPQSTTYESLSNSINPTAFSWEIQAVPVKVEGFRPTAHIIIDTRHMDQKKIDAVEKMIYGADNEIPIMPTPQAIFDLLSFGDTIIVTDNGDGSFDVTGSYENVYMVQDGVFRVDNVDGQDNGDGTFTISTTYE